MRSCRKKTGPGDDQRMMRGDERQRHCEHHERCGGQDDVEAALHPRVESPAAARR